MYFLLAKPVELTIFPAMQKLWHIIKRLALEYTSPVFILLLLLATILWYIIKLSNTYTAEIPVRVQIGENRFWVTCMAEGTGSRILAYRYLPGKDVVVKPENLQLTPSPHNKDAFIINPFSLQNAISLKNSDVKFVSLGELPEIILPIDEP